MCYLNNICFVCLCNKDNLSAVYNKEIHSEIYIQVEYALPELTISNSEFPVHICYSCQTTLCSFYAFKKNCLENYSRLKNYLKAMQKTNTQIREINCDQPIKQEHQQDIEMNIKEQNVDPLLPFSGTEQQVFSELEMKIDDNIQVIKHEPEVHIISNVQEDNIDVKDESFTSEDSADRELYQHFVKCETVYDDEQDGASSVSNPLDKDEVVSSKEYQCTICNQVFSDKLIFNTHTSIHIKKIQDPTNAVLLPNRSKERYEKQYTVFCEWRKAKGAKGVNQELILAFLYEQSDKYKPSSLWSFYSMLKKTLISYKNVNMGNFYKVSFFLKTKSLGYVPKKSADLSREDVEKFLKEASNEEFLLVKAITIFGVYGGCRRQEMCDVKVQNVKEEGSMIVVRTETHVSRTFTILPNGNGFNPVDLLLHYMKLRPSHVKNDRFFLSYRKKSVPYSL